jgi:hypothetical protein
MEPPIDLEPRPAPPGPPVNLVFDCADPVLLGGFWRQALGDEEATPPDGYASWAEYSAGVPRPSEEERRRIEAGVAPLAELGATVLRRNEDPEDWYIVLQDPEGNEFCLV